MDILTAKKQVIEAGHKLIECGLIARTWGNISCRISDKQFVITPSGRSYENLKPDDIVTVNIADCAYEGSIKPSSEKGIHADCYRLRPDVNFVIHTHQTNASVLSVLQMDVLVNDVDAVALMGGKVPCAAYGLPGTKKLRHGVSSALLSNPDSKAILMAHHGALCAGRSFEEAFRISAMLEKICEDKLTGADNIAAYSYNGVSGSSTRTENGFSLVTANNGAQDDGRETQIHRAIYDARPDVHYILHDTNPYVLQCAEGKKTMKPLLDDFAQLVGINLKIAKDCDKDIAKKVKSRNAVLVKGKGAYCFAATEGDAKAVEMILNKGCKTQFEANLLGKPKVIGMVDSLLMRVIYLKKYSKKI